MKNILLIALSATFLISCNSEKSDKMVDNNAASILAKMNEVTRGAKYYNQMNTITIEEIQKIAQQ